jgi:hypothetical protein
VTTQRQSKGTLKKCKNSTQIIVTYFLVGFCNISSINVWNETCQSGESTSFEVVSARLPRMDVINRTDDEKLRQNKEFYIKHTIY